MRQKASDLPEDRLRNIEAGLTRAREVHKLEQVIFNEITPALFLQLNQNVTKDCNRIYAKLDVKLLHNA